MTIPIHQRATWQEENIARIGATVSFSLWTPLHEVGQLLSTEDGTPQSVERLSYGIDDQRIGVQFPARASYFALLHSNTPGTGAQPAQYPTGNPGRVLTNRLKLVAILRNTFTYTPHAFTVSHLTMSMFPNLYSTKEPLKYFFVHRGSLISKTGNKTDAVGSAGRLLHYCQLPDRNSRDTTTDIWNFARYLKFCQYLSHDFSMFHGPLAGKHWNIRREQHRFLRCDTVQFRRNLGMFWNNVLPRIFTLLPWRWTYHGPPKRQ